MVAGIIQGRLEGVFKVKQDDFKKKKKGSFFKPFVYLIKGVLSPLLLVMDYNENKRLDEVGDHHEEGKKKKVLSPKEEKRRRAKYGKKRQNAK